MLRSIIFSLISIFIVCTAGCTMPLSENSNKENEDNEEFIGCAPGIENDENNESCTITENNENNEILLFENQTSENEIDEIENSEENNNTGVYEGMNVPNFSSLIHYYNSTNWENFELESLFDNNWNSSENNSSKWITIIFISTDCSHCWNAGDEISEWEPMYRDKTQFLILAVNFSSSNNFNATPEELIAFQEKNDYFGCYSNTKNCNERPGEPHEFPYIDDRNQSIMYDWEVKGTPAQFIIRPDGVMEWNVYQHRTSNGGDGETFEQALSRLFG